MSNQVKTIAAFFLFQDYPDDPNVEISRDEISNRHNSAEKFVNTTNELLNILSNNEFESDIDIQTVFYDVAKKNYGEKPKELKVYFELLYSFLFLSTRGPRWGSFVNCFGKENFCQMVDDKLNMSIVDIPLHTRELSDMYEIESILDNLPREDEDGKKLKKQNLLDIVKNEFNNVRNRTTLVNISEIVGKNV